MSDAARTSSPTTRLVRGRLGPLGSRRRSPLDQAEARNPRGRLFRKYVSLFVGLVSFVLLINGGLDFWFSYRENRTSLILIQQAKADAVGERIAQFIHEIEGQIGWTTHAEWAADSIEVRRRDFARLLRQVPAITALIQLDGAGKEQLEVSRSAKEVVGSEADYSREASFSEAVAHHVWFSPVCAFARVPSPA